MATEKIIIGGVEITPSKFYASIDDTNAKERKANNSEIVIDTVVETEKIRIIDFVKETGVRAVELIKKLESELNKLNKPDSVQHVNNGKGIFTSQESFTDARFKQLQNAATSYKNVVEAFDKAMETGTLVQFEQLKAVLDKNDKPKQ